MRKPFSICENKDADQCLCFCYIDSIISLLPNSEISRLIASLLLWLYSPVCVGPYVGNHLDRFCCDAACIGDNSLKFP